MKIFQQQHEVQKLPKSDERAERRKAATQEAERHFNAQAQRVVSGNVEVEEAEASQRVATSGSGAGIKAMARIVSQDDKPDDEMAEPVISYPEEENWEKLDGPAQNTRSQHHKPELSLKNSCWQH